MSVIKPQLTSWPLISEFDRTAPSGRSAKVNRLALGGVFLAHLHHGRRIFGEGQRPRRGDQAFSGFAGLADRTRRISALDGGVGIGLARPA